MASRWTKSVDPASPAKSASPTKSAGGSPTAGSDPTRSVEHILAEKRAAFDALMTTANALSRELLARGIDVLAPNPGQTGLKVRMPLNFFDNLDLERDTPEGWVQRSKRMYGKKPNAILLLPDGSGTGGGVFRPGRVNGYDAKKHTFEASPSGADGRVLDDVFRLPRLSVMFLSEKVSDFARRVAEAHASRDECEGALLMKFYITNMPTHDVRTLNELQVSRARTHMHIRTHRVMQSPRASARARSSHLVQSGASPHSPPSPSRLLPLLSPLNPIPSLPSLRSAPPLPCIGRIAPRAHPQHHTPSDGRRARSHRSHRGGEAGLRPRSQRDPAP